MNTTIKAEMSAKERGERFTPFPYSFLISESSLSKEFEAFVNELYPEATKYISTPFFSGDDIPEDFYTTLKQWIQDDLIDSSERHRDKSLKKYALRDFYWFYLVSILKTHWKLSKAKIQEIKRRVFLVDQSKYVQQLTKKKFLFNPSYFEFLIYLSLYKKEGVYAFISEEGDILFDTKKESEDQKRFFEENPVLTISFEYLKQWIGTLPGITEKTKKLSEADKKIIHHFTQGQDSWIAKNTLVKQRKGSSSTRLVITEYYLQENTTRQDIRELEIKRQTRYKVGEYEGKKAYILEYTKRII